MKYASSDYELDTLIRGLGDEKCTVVFFHLPWCAACQKMSPLIEEMSRIHPKTMFIKADADKCISATKRNNVTKVPLFILYNNKTRVDRIEGASPSVLETKIRFIEHDLDYKASGRVHPLAVTPPGIKHSDVSSYLDKKNCRCINDLIPTGFPGFLEGKKLASGKGVGRLLLVYTFTERMVLQSIRLKAPLQSGPKTLRLFINLDKPLDLSLVNQMTPIQEINLLESDLSGEHSIDLKPGGLIGVKTLQIYIPQNMTKSKQIEIDQMILYGGPLAMTTFAQMDMENMAVLQDLGAGGVAGSSQKTKNYKPRVQSSTSSTKRNYTRQLSANAAAANKARNTLKSSSIPK